MRRILVFIITLSILAGAWWPYSTHASRPEGAFPRHMPRIRIFKNSQTTPFCGKGVNLVSGLATLATADLRIGTLYPIAITRRYDSRSSFDSPMGYGWAINYDKRIYTYPDGSVTIRMESGWKKRFTLDMGVYLSPTGESGTLVKNADGSFTYTYKNGSKDNYDTYGRLSSMLDAKGTSNAITYELDTRSPLWGLLPANLNQSSPLIVAYDYRISRIEEKDAAGNLTNKYVLFHYDSTTGRLSDIVDSAGRTVTYTHDSIGNLTGMSGPAGTFAYAYTDTAFKHRITSIDEGDGVYVNTYDIRGRVSRQTHGTGIIDITYTTPYKKTTVTTTIKDTSGNVLNTQTRTLEFVVGQLSKATDAFGNVITYAMNGSMQVTYELQYENTGTVSSPTLTLQSATYYTYDIQSNMLTKTEAQGTSLEETTTYTYDPVYSKILTQTVKSVVNPAQNKVITNTIDPSNGNLLTTTETGLLGDGTAYSYTTTYTYNANGMISSIDGPRTDVNDITTLGYDIAGNLTSVTQPIIGTTTFSNHDALGNPQTVTDPNGNVITYAYDSNGLVTAIRAPGDTASTQYFYVSGGCSSCGSSRAKIDHITLPEGNSIYFTYDSMGKLSTIADSQSNTINYTYDSEGNKLTEQIKDPSNTLQKTLSFQYDAISRLKRVTNPDSSYTEYTYDFKGNRTAVRNPNAATTSYVYDVLNRLTTVTQPGTVTTAFGHNTNNAITTVTDANNNTTTYRYDDNGRVYQVISPDSGTTTYAYDPAGDLTSKTDANGITVSYTYDALNRLTQMTFPDTTQNIGYSYDTCPNGKGKLCSMTDPSGTTAYEYTAKGQVRKETKTIDSIVYITQYTYDQNGNLKTMTYPSGRVITYNYTNDRAVSVLNNAANLATGIMYKPFGGMSSLTYGNGISGSITYDNQYRIASSVGGTVLNLSYADDANGNITGITNTLEPTKNKSFTYDNLDRLATATSAGIWGSLSWSYDGVGNRQTENSNSYTYAPNTSEPLPGLKAGASGILA